MQTLARAFVDYDLDLIQIIASQWDIDLAASDRAAAADELADAITSAGSVQATWQRLSDEQQKAVFDLLLHEGRIPYSHFIRRYGEPRPMGPARREREKPWLTPENITEALYYRGLIVRAFDHTPSGAMEYVTIPSDLKDLLPRPPADFAPSAPGYAVAPPRRLALDHLLSPDDTATSIAYLRLRKTNAREWLVISPIVNIDRHLRRPIPAYRAMLTALMYDLSLINDDELMGHITTVVNRDISRPWLEAPRAHQIRSLVEAWVNSILWNDLTATPGIEADHWPNDPRAARQAVLETLKNVPAEIWWNTDSLVDHIKENNPDFQRPGGDYGGWYLRDVETGEIMHGFQYWDNIEGMLIRFMIEGPMNWLGITRVGRGAFLLTQSGRALLGRDGWPDNPDPPVKIRVDEQGVISVPVEISRYDRIQIARFAAWISTPPARESDTFDDSVYLYRLTPQAVERVSGDGIQLMQHIVPFLQKLSGQSVPQNVLKMLEEWHTSPSQVVIQDVVIIRARDLSVYERLRRTERVNKWLREQVGPQAHTVNREDLPALLNALRQMGILPLFEGHEKDDWP